MSDTPKTDAVKIACGFQAVPEPMFQHARQLERENAALRAQDAWLIATFGNREDENAALRAELEAQAVVNGKGGEREAKLLAENAALRTALNDFRSLSFIALLAPVPDCRPHYDLVKKHWALLNNESTKEAQP